MKRHDFSPERRAASRLLLGLASLALATGCGQSQAPQERRIVPHRVPGCGLTPNSRLVLKALGDFADPSAADVNLTEEQDLPLPFALRGVEATTPPSGLLGVGYADPPDDIHLSLWSSGDTCTPIEDVVPPSSGGQAMTAFAGGNAVLVAGLEPRVTNIGDSAFALAWDARTGEKLAPVGLGPNRRAWASATSFGNGALVAGGVDHKFVPEKLMDSALVFLNGAFQDQTISLGDPRARQGAVVLTDGSTLLVGGEDENHSALASMVAVVPSKDPPFGRANIFGLGTLAVARKSPTVLRLANDKILVAGGIDDTGQPVSTLEWFTKDGYACRPADDCPPPQSLLARPDRAFVALSAGGALAVGVGPDPNGGPTTVGDVWWITDEGALDPLAPLSDAQLGTKKLRLVPAANGSPWLWNGVSWFRFDPWQKKFVAPAPGSAPSDGPDDDLPIISVDPGLMTWLQRVPDPDAGDLVTKVRGFRHDVRGPLARDTKFVFADRELQHLVPDRPPGVDISIEDDGLHLASEGTVAIADTTYGDVLIVGKTHSTSVPGIKLGSSFVVGEGNCAWTLSSAADAGASTDSGADARPSTDRSFEVRRSGTSLRLKVEGVAGEHLCAFPEGRVSIGLTNLGSSPVIVSELTVTRTAPP